MRKLLFLSIFILTVPLFARMNRVPARMRKSIMDTLELDDSEIGIITMKNSGKIYIKFFPDDAPNTVKNFIMLSRLKFYDGLIFHRVIKGFVAQGGDPLGTGYGDAGYNIKAEFNNRPHLTGTLAMARSQDPNSASSQFYICLAPQPGLDTKYTVFGQVIKGMKVVENIKKGDVMKSVRIKSVGYNSLKTLLKKPAIYTLPIPKKMTQPVYPAKKEGTVILRILINKDGGVDKVRILKSVSPAIDSSAIKSAKTWLFTPAKIEGEPINDWINYPVKFTLKK
jgi:peptidylprolyl isomerase/peptidyl-prolyl cis-trans isomerase B (cyclophilin B)